MTLRHVDLCSGIGGFALGFEWAGLSSPVMFCDIEPWSRKILAQHWPDVPIAEDVKELANDARRLVPDCDILTAGYPCQPFSVAGKQKGTADDRHIWPYIRAIIAQKRPTWCVFENVYGHVALGLDQVLADLEAEGYASRTFIVPACGVDAPHRRDRLWIVAHTDSQGEPDGAEHVGEGERLVGDTQHDGSPTTALSGEHREDEGRCAQGQEEAEQSAGTGEPRDDADVGNAEDDGRDRRSTQARRAGAQDFTEQPQSGVRGKSGRPSQNVADTESEQRDERQHTVSGEQAGKEGLRGEAGTSGQALADAHDAGRQQSHEKMAGQPSEQLDSGSFQSREDVADARRIQCEGRGQGQVLWEPDIPSELGRGRQDIEIRWPTEPDVGRVANGVPKRVDRLKGLGNAIVPQLAMRIGLTIKAVHDK